MEAAVQSEWGTLPIDKIDSMVSRAGYDLFEGKVVDKLSEIERRRIAQFFHHFYPFVDSPVPHRSGPPPDWDLRDQSRQWPLKVRRVELNGSPLKGTGYMLRPGFWQTSVTWILVVKNPLAVALCLRHAADTVLVEPRYMMEECIMALVKAGFLFNVARRWDRRVHGGWDYTYELPMTVRPPEKVFRDHKWNQRDYDHYLDNRADFLRSGRGRQALRAGGILSYLASQTISGYEAVKAPHTGHDYYPDRYHIDNERCISDLLTTEEIYTLCGVFDAKERKEVSNDQQVVYYSYWPPPDIWWKSKYGMYWTPAAQQFVEKRENELAQKPQPKRFGEWATVLGKFRGQRKLDNNAKEETRRALEDIERRQIEEERQQQAADRNSSWRS
jgi:hypothetical protein